MSIEKEQEILISQWFQDKGRWELMNQGGTREVGCLPLGKELC